MMMTAAHLGRGVSSGIPRHRPDLFQAIVNRDLREISSLMKSGASWDWPDDSGQTVLHMAVKKRCKDPHEQKDVIRILNKFLNRHRIKVDVKCDAGRTALHIAAKNGMLRVVNFLIEREASLHARDERGNSIAHYMVDGEFDKCFELTRKGSSPDELRPVFEESVEFFREMLSKNISVNYVNKNQETPLHVAVRRNLLHIIPILLEHTHDVTVRDKQNQNVLHSFIENKYSGTFKAISNTCYDKTAIMDIFKMMLSKGYSMIDVDVHGNTPLHNAVYQDKPAFIKLMLEKFEEVDMCDSDGNTILHIVIDNCIDQTTKDHKDDYEELVQILVSNGTDIDRPNKNGLKPLHLAVMRVHSTILQVLEMHGADLKEPYNGGNLLHLLSNTSELDSPSKLEVMIALLVSQGCDVNERDEDGMTPMHLAVKSGRIDVIEGLLSCCADIDARDFSDRGLTPLQMAVDCGKDYLLETLIKFGADVNAKDSSKKTALHLAMESKNDMVKTLLSSGAYLDVEDDEKLLPLHYAIKNQNGVALAELLKFGADINDIDTYQELLCLKNPDYMLFTIVEHWIKMKAAGLPIAPDYSKHSFEDVYHELYHDCLKEIEDLKAFKVGDRTSLYDLLHMDRNFKCAYTGNAHLKDLIESPTLETQFPNYHVLILASYHESVARQPLLEPANRAWYEFTEILLPEVCVYKILTHLSNRDLRLMVEGLKDLSVR